MATTSRDERYLAARLQVVVGPGAADRAVGAARGRDRYADQGAHRHARSDMRSALMTLGLAFEEEASQDRCGGDRVITHGYIVDAA